MNTEEMAGCFLHYREHFTTIHTQKKGIAEKFLKNFLADPDLSEEDKVVVLSRPGSDEAPPPEPDPSDAKNFRKFVALATSDDQDIAYIGYEAAAKAYQQASQETRSAVKELVMKSDPDPILIKYAMNGGFLLKKPSKKSAFTTIPGQTAEESTFTTMFEKYSFEEAYHSVKNLSLAQKLYVHNHLREKQIQSLDTIAKALKSDTGIDDRQCAEIFYTVLDLMHKNMKNEFRWTRLLGFPRKSRLDDVICEKMKELSRDFPGIQPLADTTHLLLTLEKPISAMFSFEGNPAQGSAEQPHNLVEKLRSLLEARILILQLLEPHGFLDAVQAFVKNGLHMFQKPKPKP